MKARRENPPRAQRVGWISRQNLDRLLADKWAVVEITAYEQAPEAKAVRVFCEVGALKEPANTREGAATAPAKTMEAK